MTLNELIFNAIKEYNDHVWYTDGITDDEELADILTEKVEQFYNAKKGE